MKRYLRFQVSHAQAGAALVDFLAARFPYHSAAAWAARVAAGQIHRNGEAPQPEARLALGDLIEYTAPGIPEPEVSFDVRVLHRDLDLLVLDKPPNLPCHPGGSHFQHTLWAYLKTHEKVDSPEFVNRIDRETSGVVVVALTPEAARKCRAQFAGRQVQKRYVALVEGRFPAHLSARGHIVPDPHSPVRKKLRFLPEAPAGAADEAGEPARGATAATWAETEFRLLAVHGDVSEVEASPRTGRQHQIRATLGGLGFPITGDKLYGVDPSIFLRFCTHEMTEDDRVRLRHGRQALHAASVTLRHPRTGLPVTYAAPIPEDMLTLAQTLDKATRAVG